MKSIFLPILVILSGATTLNGSCCCVTVKAPPISQSCCAAGCACEGEGCCEAALAEEFNLVALSDELAQAIDSGDTALIRQLLHANKRLLSFPLHTGSVPLLYALSLLANGIDSSNVISCLLEEGASKDEILLVREGVSFTAKDVAALIIQDLHEVRALIEDHLPVVEKVRQELSKY